MGQERKAKFYGHGSRQDNDFLSHVPIAFLQHTEFPGRAFKQTPMFQSVEDPEERSKAYLDGTA